MDDMRFSQSEVQNEIFPHIPPRSLLLLSTSGVIEWIDEHQDGRGIHRVYGLANLYQIAVATQLSLVGFSYNSIKTLVMDKLKGSDEEGKPNILNYMTQLLGVKVGEEKLKRRRYPLFQVSFDKPENIDSLVRKLYEPFEIPDLLQKLIGKKTSNIQPITILIINLPELALKVKSAIELAQKG
jgi:hypothetical protein